MEKTNNQNDVQVEGILEIHGNRTGQLLDPARQGKTRNTDPFVPRELIRRFKLRRGSYIKATASQDPRKTSPLVRYIESSDGMAPEARRRVPDFSTLTTITPDERLRLETKDGKMTVRVMDLFSPIGKGQRGLIVAPPRTGKTTLLCDIALGVLDNHPECHVMMVLIAERPAEIGRASCRGRA